MVLFNKKNFIFLLNIGLILLFLFVNFGCNYSFTGASVPDHIKSIAIPPVQNRSGSGEPTLELFTDELIQKFIEDNTLQVTEKVNADALLECTILSMNEAPAVISGDEKVPLIRLTLNVKVIYKDLVKKKTIFEKNFSNYFDYDNSTDITQARTDAINIAMDKIYEDILLSVVSNW
ncbi:MAG: LptE family protein [Ignavibacteriales bacterium]|nr:LptE family protein [Ignavibacteriales bacterium]